MAHVYLGFLTNSYTSALVTPQGSVDWLPFPRFDSSAIFCRLLDKSHGGYFSIQPDGDFQSQQTYKEGTNILVTMFDTPQGHAEMHDFLPIGQTALWRVIETDIPLVLTCSPTFDFGCTTASYEILDQGACFLHPGDKEGLVLHIEGPMEKMPPRDVWRIGPGSVAVRLQYTGNEPEEKDALNQALVRPKSVEVINEQFWRRIHSNYTGVHAEMVDRAVLVMRGLTYRTTGGCIAAATTSLPEEPGGTRQWDYRFVWVRDGSYAAEALLLAGDIIGCRQYLSFVFNTLNIAGQPFAAPFFRVDGTLTQGEHELLWLSGYEHSRPVRVGNGANSQLQLDIEGDFLWPVWLYWHSTQDSVFIQENWIAITALVTWAQTTWHEADASLWEFRADDDVYTHSRMMCWVALKVGASLADQVMHDSVQARTWDLEAQTVESAIWAQQQASGLPYFTQGAHHPQMDAALLTMVLYGFVAWDQPVFARTLSQIEKDLVQNDRVFRYRQDNMGPAHFAFTLAGFWLARVYLRMGETQRADALIDAQIAGATTLGLFAEHTDPDSQKPHGNFPQLFPHAALVTTLTERQRQKEGQLPGYEQEFLSKARPPK